MGTLDLKDKKILYELDLNSRRPYKEIAKKVGVSKDSVIYRINKLQESGIIKKFHTIIDVGKLGLSSFRLYLKLQNTTPEKEKEIIKFLKNQKEITWIVSIEGEFDIGMWILAKSTKEVKTLWKEILTKYRDFIEKRQLTIFTKVSYFPRAYILDKRKNNEEFTFITEPEKTKLDDIDINLLKLLAPNARISILEISDNLKVTPKTIAARIKQLENKKVILGYRTMLDLEKLEYQYFKIHFNLYNLSKEKEEKFKNFLKQHPNIIYDNEVLGGDDIEIEAQMKTLQDLRNFLEEVKKQFSTIIKNHKYMLFYKEHKYLFFPTTE